MKRGAVAAAIVMGALAACTAHAPTGPFDDGVPNDASADDAGPTLDGQLMSAADASLFEAGCATGSLKATKGPIYLLVVLDGSGSMFMDAKWSAVVPALGLFIDDLAMQADHTFGLGLTIFSDTNDATGGKGPYPSMDVPIGFVDTAHAGALHARIDGAQPKGDTPTVAVLQGQLGALESFAPPSSLTPGGKKALVFMTDGVPYPDPGTQQAQSVQTVSAAWSLGPPRGPVTTLAVGIGYYFPYAPSDYDQKFMGQIAVAGGAPNPACDPSQTWDSTKFCHFQVTPNSANDPAQLEQEFLLAFDKVRSRLATCTLTLEKTSPVEPDRVNVVFTDDLGYVRVVPESTTDGWTYDVPDDPSSVTLHGTACDDLKKNVHGKVDVVLGCRTIVR
jgi:hypothetical protein